MSVHQEVKEVGWLVFQKKGKSNPTFHIKKSDNIQNRKKKKEKQKLCNQQSTCLKSLVLVSVNIAHNWNSLALGVRIGSPRE